MCLDFFWGCFVQCQDILFFCYTTLVYSVFSKPICDAKTITFFYIHIILFYTDWNGELNFQCLFWKTTTKKSFLNNNVLNSAVQTQ